MVSGGLDSSTLLAMAVDHAGPGNVRAISVDYGQSHKKELERAVAVTKWCGLPDEPFRLVIPSLGGALTQEDKGSIPMVDYEEIEGLSPAYVPFRNGSMLSLAAAFAMRENYQQLWYGAHMSDWGGSAYPDCSPDFVSAMGKAIHIGTDKQVTLIAPFLRMTKDRIVAKGEELGVPFAMTWSCYLGKKKHCGTCPTCRDRRNAFKTARVDDPTDYADE